MVQVKRARLFMGLSALLLPGKDTINEVTPELFGGQLVPLLGLVVQTKCALCGFNPLTRHNFIKKFLSDRNLGIVHRQVKVLTLKFSSNSTYDWKKAHTQVHARTIIDKNGSNVKFFLFSEYCRESDAFS